MTRLFLVYMTLLNLVLDTSIKPGNYVETHTTFIIIKQHVSFMLFFKKICLVLLFVSLIL